MDENRTAEELFIESLYDEANEELKGVYGEYKNNRDGLLKEIAMIILSYTVLNNAMGLSKKEKEKEYSKLSLMIKEGLKSQSKLQDDVLEKIVTNTVKNTFDFYSYNASLKDIGEIINKNFKGKHFSERVWDNEKEVAKRLHSQIDKFLNGKININQIKKDIEKTFNTSAYNAKRLTETEVNRCEDEAFRKFCREVGVKKVRRNEVLDSRTCGVCASLDGKLYNLDDAPGVVHPLCRGFNTIEDYEKVSKINDEIAVSKDKPITMDLQLFGLDDWKLLQRNIEGGIIDNDKFEMCYNEFNKIFKDGVKTPLGIVKCNDKTFAHISQRHPDMIDIVEIVNIFKTLVSPDAVYETKDKSGLSANCYIKNINKRTLLTIIRNDIITSYYPSNNYLSKNILGGRILWEEK